MDFGVMRYLSRAIGLFGAAAVGSLTMPAFADTATTQVGTQSATINGDNNQVIQVINQVNVDHPGLGRGRANNSQRGTVQDSYQGATVDGSGNEVVQESNQVNHQRQAEKPGRRVRQSQDNHPSANGNGRGPRR